MQHVTQEIVRGVQGGTLSAFEEVLEVYEKPLFAHILRLVHTRDDAADVLQETFIKLYRYRSTIDEEKNFSAWLYTIASRTAYDWLKKAHHKNELLLLDDDEARIAIETNEPAASYNSIEAVVTAYDLEKALTGLKETERLVLTLYYRDGFSYLEIADILLLPLNTVKTHLSRAKQHLHTALQETYGTTPRNNIS